jgi:hypothetical protein
MTAQSPVTGCGTAATSTVTVNQNSTIGLSSAVGTNAQTVCVNNAITDITYAIGGGGTGASITAGALPVGVTGSFAAGVFTISGTPTVSGNFSYTITTTGPCVNNTASGTVTVNANATISRTSAVGTDAQAVCLNSSIADITYAIGGVGTGASITAGALPAGVTGTFAAGVFTISGTATVAGVYNYTITATGGSCTQSTASGTITVNTPPTGTFSKKMASSCGGGADGTITVAISGGTTPYNYSWTSSPAGFTANTASITGLSPRDYSLVVTDAGNCTLLMSNITIWQAFTPTLTNNGGISGSCNNTGYIILYGSNGLTPYMYSVDGINYQSSNIFTNLAAGTYTGYVKDSANCIGTKPNINVGAASPIVVTAYVSSASSCANNGSIQLFRTGGVGPYTYSLNDVTYQVSNVFSNLAGGTYTGWVKDSKGCKASLGGLTIVYAPPITVTSTKINTSACTSNNGYIALHPGGGVPGYTYSLTGPTGPWQGSNVFTGLAAGSYNGWVLDSKGCKNAQFGIVIGTDPASVITVTANPQSTGSCANNGSIVLYRTGGTAPFTYSLDNITYQTGNTFTGLASGTYTGWVKDSKGCTGSLSGITVTQAPALTTTGVKTNTSSCINDGTIRLYPAGGVAPYTYSSDDITYQTSYLLTGLAAGNYTAWVMDSRGCKASVNLTISLNPIVVTAYAANASNCVSADGSIQLFLTGGTGPYSYSLDGTNYQLSNVFSGKTAGTYTGYVKDSKTCVASLANIVVGPNCPPPFAATKTKTVAVKIAENVKLSVQAYPNPSSTEFTLILTGNSPDKVSITVTDIMGRKVYQTEGSGKQQYKFGNNLKSGIYMVLVVQGANNQSIKLVKE